MNQYEPVIGLEVHVQLKTESKIFCACRTAFGAEPNQNTCPVCFGLPGSLPVLNERVLELAIKVGLALDCEISPKIKFDRKNYFYPDLPKAYQISQYDMPVSKSGYLIIRTTAPHPNPLPRQIEGGQAQGEGRVRVLQERKIGITRAHLEEDAGKLLHEGITDGSWVDYNRAGVPLLEIVSEPDIRSPDEAYDYLMALKSILQYLDVSDCNMEEGSLRCDANISVRKKRDEKLGTKVEIKNLNSFRAVQKAIAFEIERQTGAVEGGETIRQETRLWNEGKQETISMRSKEFAHDYRYFPEPDLVPFSVPATKIEDIRKSIPELPFSRMGRFQSEYGLSEYDAKVLIADKKWADFFEECIKEKVNPKLVSNWLQTDTAGLLNERKIEISAAKITAKTFAGLIKLIEKGTISGKIAKEVLPMMLDTGNTAEAIVKEKGMEQVTDVGALEQAIDRVIQENPGPAGQVREGKKQAMGFLVGKVMQLTGGKANPKMVNELLAKKLS
ncbi:MAG: aspartyl/glutamyl-tRNA amidotransferase subunit B [Omnitrophica bacterium RIFCSPLOWO2_12_FULL_44_17]|uniref:Aspartyl/glutamyl-tRNA(Asn/Gln) amidotransferase subunit B n=1 Tax=Candidatus Danuiimicrobium aquiferis TaxID=1801832 RepID=A0A1G1KSN8_9BACT|nr:MAG: aspartyl/glutamyl-tRNA amidotransferase subunit B [Omnitrophica bacterium RIFCSPHIGHO2_02_FULL_45_28]OGW91444.1 MAG: aspartyl/glutamyl-tRNA amidotransferase subunit B [Omnitrophica bacterium RIFCSPHIGHO2_12_FULL_44_12]OGW95921.1 MAG: aspartyl/glutamyl-tRNA amidotransferase subunit B [Omnitrophica bacterium RIFCSPLOWO2_12_FULL_44_17]OGX01920.1 MAG: aspartyl/glutamyl-tRNA amidotransferase subunit B [Omnitrophica bacterium RIFCSPLOWO2_02_FULL_44_11]